MVGINWNNPFGRKEKTCIDCGGTGKAPIEKGKLYTPDMDCAFCDGDGKVLDSRAR